MPPLIYKRRLVVNFLNFFEEFSRSTLDWGETLFFFLQLTDLPIFKYVILKPVKNKEWV